MLGTAVSGFTQAGQDCVHQSVHPARYRVGRQTVNGSKSGPLSGVWRSKSTRRVSDRFLVHHRSYGVSAAAVLNDSYGAGSPSLKGQSES